MYLSISIYGDIYTYLCHASEVHFSHNEGLERVAGVGHRELVGGHRHAHRADPLLARRGKRINRGLYGRKRGGGGVRVKGALQILSNRHM